jgi:hypothetical protein
VPARKPTAILDLNGAFKKNPDRGRARKNEPKPTGPLGPPPEFLTSPEKLVWFELDEIAPPKVLTNSDRWTVEIAVRLMNRVREDGIGGKYGISVGELAQLNQCLIRMGMTPADRSKIGVPPDDDKKNPFAQLDHDEENEDRPN